MDRAGQFCANLLRERDRDRYLATLLVDSCHREDISTILALDTEILHVIDQVREPMAGQIRLQWWRDVIAGERANEAGSNPLAASILDLLKRHEGLAPGFDALLDQRIFDLYHDPMPDMGTFEGYCGEVYGFQLLASFLVAGRAQDSALAELSGHGGMVAGIAAVILDLERSRANEKLFVPESVLGEMGTDRKGFLAAGATDKKLRDVYGWLAAKLESHYHLFEKSLATLARHERAITSWVLPKAIAANRLALMGKEAKQGEWRPPSPLSRQWQMAKANWFGWPKTL